MAATYRRVFKFIKDGIRGRKIAPISGFVNDSFSLVFKVFDRAGNEVDFVSDDMTLKIAKKGDDSVIRTVTESDGISVAAHVVTVDFKADSDLALSGTYTAQLFQANGSDSVVILSFDLELSKYVH